MRKLLLGTAIVGLLLAAAPTGLTGGGTTETQVSGTYLFGSPVAYLALDACGNGRTNGLDSSCAPVPPGAAAYGIDIQDSLGSIAAFSVCFYGSGRWIACDTPTVPDGATEFSVSSLGGAAVHWTVTFTS